MTVEPIKIAPMTFTQGVYCPRCGLAFGTWPFAQQHVATCSAPLPEWLRPANTEQEAQSNG